MNISKTTELRSNTCAVPRLPYIDIAKGILIALVVIGHIIRYDIAGTNIIKTIIYTFHMPAFLIISGILLNTEKICKTSFSCFLKKKAFRLLVPYCIFEIMGGLLQMILMGTATVNITGILYGLLTIHCNIGADWFLPTLFFAEIIIYFYLIFLKNRFKFEGLVFFFLVALIVPDASHALGCVKRVLVACAFLLVGAEFKKQLLKPSFSLLIVSILSVCVSVYCNGRVDLASRNFQNPILYLTGGISGTYLVLYISQLIPTYSYRILEKAGQSSIIILGTHQNIMVIANMIWGSVYSIPLQLFLLPVIALYEIITIWLLNHYFPWISGRHVT